MKLSRSPSRRPPLHPMDDWQYVLVAFLILVVLGLVLMAVSGCSNSDVNRVPTFHLTVPI